MRSPVVFVEGDEMMAEFSMEAERRAALLEKANALPRSPGVYLMKDKADRVIYVGKSRSLKNRVSQYFQQGEKQVKTARMVSRVASFEYILTDTEMEALTLENSLIKQYAPKYNIRLKDAKAYPYIKVTLDEAYPRLIMTRRRSNDKARYFGPYSGTATVFSVIGTLQKTLGLPSCKRVFPRDIGRDRPCIYYQMGQCAGLCTGEISREEHGRMIRLALDILRGSDKDARRALEEEMYRAADEERFEAAARLRDSIAALDRLGERQKVVASPDADQDVVALQCDEAYSCLSVFYIRSGRVTDHEEFLFTADQIADESAIVSFLCDLYTQREYIPREILLGLSLGDEDVTLFGDYVSRLAERKISVRIPERGDKHKLVGMVESNAADYIREYRRRAERDDATLIKLASLLALEVIPDRIEAYDISNLGSEHITAGMIVWANGGFRRRDYRSFTIRGNDGPDDYAAMREALSRRLAHLGEGQFGDMPDLILLDGGKGHVSTVRSLLEELGLDIPVFGMVKDSFHKTRALTDDHDEISIAREQAVFGFVYRIQEEVHRYTVSRMQGAKRKTLTTSSLEQIPGIGPAKAKRLLAHFGSIKRIREASAEEIAALPGFGRRDAHAISSFFSVEGHQ
ncbi:MAG: excinuclease ABC subunit UvrC [Clostridia bacterium]|nr:excinuclease ABC subunit UvrC [Clostridia bacterium]